VTVEALLAYAHLLAILTMVVFISSEAALCRPEWMNPQLVERLARVDAIYGASAVFVFLTGLARVFLGAKGGEWYGGNWLLWTKFGLFVAVGLTSIKPTLQFVRWRKALRASGAMPSADEVTAVRRLIMLQAHIIPFIPLAAVFLARGYGQ
jgi:putative membrane protein